MATKKITKNEKEVLNDVEWLTKKIDSDDSLEKEKNKTQVFVLPGFIKFIIGMFLLVIVVSWLIPYYYIGVNPSPIYKPELLEVFNSIQDWDGVKNNYTNYSYENQYILLINDGILDTKVIADRVSSLACDYGDNYQICQAKALYYFVQNELDYIPDPVTYDYVKAPMESLASYGGDCDDAAVLLSSMLGAVGIKTRLVFVPRHVYVEAYMPNIPSYYKSYKNENWVTLDATCKNCKFGENVLKNIKADKRYLYVD